MLYYTMSQTNVPPLACYNFDTHEWILIFFDTNVTDKVSNQKTVYYATWNNLCFCTTCQNEETRKSHFSLNWIVYSCYTHNAPVRCLPERKNCHLCVWLRLTFVEIVRHPINTLHWLLLQAWRRTALTFSQWLTQWQTWLTQSMRVTDSWMLCYLPRSCLEHPADNFDSEGWLSSDHMIFLTVFHVFGEKACSI